MRDSSSNLKSTLDSADFRLELETLIKAKESVPYVYTYPPKGAYQNSVSEADVLRSWTLLDEPINLYIHVPFCKMKCSFCTLFTTVSKQPELQLERYMSALIREFKIVSQHIQSDKVRLKSIYFGGGTPGLLSSNQLAKLLSNFSVLIPIELDAEISLESTPDLFDEQKCREVKELGINRLSFGVQSFSEHRLPQLGRSYPAQASYNAVRNSKMVGVENINVDLIYGLPGQTLTDWLQEIQIAADLGVSTLSLYPLVIREKSIFGKIRKNEPGDFASRDVQRNWYDHTIRYLLELGFQQHTLVTFARTGGGCRYESQQFVGTPTLSLGAGARSYLPALHYTNADYTRQKTEPQLLQSYLTSIENDQLFIESGVHLTKEEQMIRFTILGLLSSGLCDNTFYLRFGMRLEHQFGTALEVLEQEGFLSRNAVYRLTEKGYRHSNEIGHLLMSPKVKVLREGWQ